MGDPVAEVERRIEAEGKLPWWLGRYLSPGGDKDGGEGTYYPYPPRPPRPGMKWQFFPSAGVGGAYAEVPETEGTFTAKDIAQMEQERALFDLQKQQLDVQIAQGLRKEQFEREAWMGKPQPGGDEIDDFGRKAYWDGSRWIYPPDWNVNPATRQTGYISPYQQGELDLQRQRLEQERVNREQQNVFEQQRLAADEAGRQQQLQAEKEARLASLRASPTSWLEYASLSGQAPVVQPWMTGLLPQGSNLGVGQQLPGFNPGQQKMDLPELLRPSAQYSARMGPVPQKQYLGYEQARTGAPPEQTAWYLSQTGAPAGRFGTLTRRR